MKNERSSDKNSGSAPDTGRRALLGGGVAVLAAALIGRHAAATGEQAPAAGRDMPDAAPPAAAVPEVTIENFSASGQSTGSARVAKVVKNDPEWRALLSPLAFHVTRQAGTELAFSGEYASNHADGLYHCVCCDTVLFDSRTKFESGTGWPSFWKAISPKNVVKTSDTTLGMQRDAISCHRCDAHLGHVFDDGPAPTGLRYCMNSVSLHFVKRA